MLRIFTSKWEKSIVSRFGQILVLIVAVVVSSAVFAASPDNKLDLGGYTGMDAPHMYKQLPEPIVRKGYKFTVGFLQPWSGGKPLLLIEKECEKKIKELGGKFISYDAVLDVQKQISQMNQLISQKVDLIISYPVVEAGLTQSTKLATKAGIPVLQVNVPAKTTNPLDPNVIAMVGMSFDLYGYETVKWISQKHPGAKVAFIGMALPTDNLPHIVGSAKHWAKELGLNVLGQVDAKTWNPADGGVATQAIMGRWPDVEIILTYNEYTALAAAAALRAAGKKGVLAGSMNGGDAAVIPALKDGTMLCQYLDPWAEVGEAAAIAAYRILTNQSLPAKRMLFKGQLVTKANVDSVQFVE